MNIKSTKHMYAWIYELPKPQGEYPDTYRCVALTAVLQVDDAWAGGDVPDLVVILWRGRSTHNDSREAMNELRRISATFGLNMMSVQAFTNTKPKPDAEVKFEEWYKNAIATRQRDR